MVSNSSKKYRKSDVNRSAVSRKKRSRRRGFKLDFFRIGVIAATTVVTLGVGYGIYSHLPFVKVDRAIAAGDRYTQEADYESAIDSYTQAIEIDKHSVTAYSNMAGAYLSIDDIESAKKTLYDGWQNTESEALLDNYHAVIMNEAVASLNDKDADLSTIRTVVSVLGDNPDSADAVQLLDSAYDRIFQDAYSYSPDALFRSDASTYSAEGGSAVFSYEEYEAFVKELMAVYESAPSDELKEVVLKYATPGVASFTISTQDASTYRALLDEVESKVGSNEKISSMKDCLVNSDEVLAVFEGIFEQLDVGNVDELRSFVVSEEYLALRNLFLNGGETPQENTTYVPISREALVLNFGEGKWTYRFLDFEENPETEGVITLWANFFEDNGIQRNSISYEPKSIDGNMYPHTKYSVTYLKSYITSGRSTKVEKMNYRLDTTITTESGEQIETIIGDWGGADEWEMDIDTIESRIKP